MGPGPGFSLFTSFFLHKLPQHVDDYDAHFFFRKLPKKQKILLLPKHPPTIPDIARMPLESVLCSSKEEDTFLKV